MAQHKYHNGAGWNREKAVGQKMAFTLVEIQQIETSLLKQENWHDLALLSLGVDSFLRAGDLLSLRVSDVTYSTGAIQSVLSMLQQKTKLAVFPELSPVTMDYIARWIRVSGKPGDAFLFTRTKGKTHQPITRNQYARIVKQWAERLGHAPDNYSTHSIRRTKPVEMYWAGEKLSLISKLLGHKSEASTLEYLGITQKKAAEASQRHPMLLGRSAKSRK